MISQILPSPTGRGVGGEGFKNIRVYSCYSWLIKGEANLPTTEQLRELIFYSPDHPFSCAGCSLSARMFFIRPDVLYPPGCSLSARMFFIRTGPLQICFSWISNPQSAIRNPKSSSPVLHLRSPVFLALFVFLGGLSG
jgi:hypothetical protein